MSVSATGVAEWIRASAATIADERDHLTKLDSAIGDADHGANMHRGFQAAVAALPADGEAVDDVGAVLQKVGMTLMSKVGGSGGPLYGTFFARMGGAAKGEVELDLGGWAAALRAGVDGVRARGKAELGDKTMIDALVPAVEAVEAAVQEGATLDDGLRRSAAAGEEGMRATTPLVARKGRASYLGERSAGHQDPGATSSWLLLRTAAETLR